MADTGSHTRGGEATRPPLNVEVVASPSNASRLRRQFQDWVAVDVPADTAQDLVLAVYEAVVNAAEHAYAGDARGPGPVRLYAWRTAEHVHVRIEDRGAWREPAEDSYRGRGLALVRELTNGVGVEASGEGTRVQLHVEIPGET